MPKLSTPCQSSLTVGLPSLTATRLHVQGAPSVPPACRRYQPLSSTREKRLKRLLPACLCKLLNVEQQNILVPRFQSPYNEFVWLSRSYLLEKTCQFFFKLFSWLLFVLCWTDTLENVVSYHTVSCYIQGLCIRVVCVHHSCIVAPPIFVCGRRGTPTFRQSSIITYMYKLLSPMFIHILISM